MTFTLVKLNETFIKRLSRKAVRCQIPALNGMAHPNCIMFWSYTAHLERLQAKCLKELGEKKHVIPSQGFQPRG